MTRGQSDQLDPTGQARNRRRGANRLRSRLSSSERKIKSLFRAIPRERSKKTRISNNEQTAFYTYQITDQELERLSAEIQFILNRALLESQSDQVPLDWYWKEDVEPPYRQGSMQESMRLEQLVSAAVIAGAISATVTLSPEQVVLSDPYRAALNRVYVENFQSIQTLSQRTASQVMQRITSGIDSRKTPTNIVADISDRFNVARSSADRTADTSINKAYNDGRTNTVSQLEEISGLRAGLIHISALTPTTRSSHAARHGNAYSVADQEQWWDTGANRRNCKCSTRSVLIDRQGRVIESGFQQEIRDEKSFFETSE